MLGGVDWRSVCVCAADLLGKVVVRKDGGLGPGRADGDDGRNLRHARSRQGGLPSLLAGHVYRLYAQRVVRCFMPDHLVSPRQTIVQAREWCNETTTSRPDPLNPESGATLRVTLINHVHRGVIAPQPQLAAAGVRHLRQLFRYDLTPLCTRLHDPIKSIPVLSADSVFISILRSDTIHGIASETTLRDAGS